MPFLRSFPFPDPMENKSIFSARLAGTVSFLVLLPVYLFTMAPTVLHIDCGELAAVQYTLGISHPTGYPLFTVLGYLFLQIPLGLKPIVQANALAAIWTAAGIGVFSTWLMGILVSDFRKPDSKTKSLKGEDPLTSARAFWVSVSAGVLLGSSLTVWAQAVAVEVYSLQILMFSLLLLCATQAWKRNEIRDWVLTSVVLGLSFSNHMTSLMSLPFLAVLYFGKNGASKASFQKLLLPGLAGIGVLGLMYGFLYARAQTAGGLNWGHIHDWESFKHHLSGHQYRTWIMAGSKVAARNLGEFLKGLPADWAFLGLVLVFVGIRPAFRFARGLSWAVVAGSAFNILYVIQYDIKDLEPYFLFSLMGMGYLAAFGLKEISSKKILNPQPYLLLLVPALSLGLHWQKSNQRETRFFATYTETALSVVEPNALIMTQQWDFFITPFYYYRYAEGKYPGITVVDKELIRRSWYVEHQLELMDPGIWQGTEKEKPAFLVALQPFENDEPFDGNVIEEAYQNLLGKILTEQAKKRPVYLGRECLGEGGVRIPAGYTVIPVAFWLKLVPEKSPYLAAKRPEFNPFIPENWKGKGDIGYYGKFVKDSWNSSLELRARYEVENGFADRSQDWMKGILPQ